MLPEGSSVDEEPSSPQGISVVRRDVDRTALDHARQVQRSELPIEDDTDAVRLQSRMEKVQAVPGNESACTACGRVHGEQPWFRKDSDMSRRPDARNAEEVASARSHTHAMQLTGRHRRRPVVGTAVKSQGAFTLMAEDAACARESE